MRPLYKPFNRFIRQAQFRNIIAFGDADRGKAQDIIRRCFQFLCQLYQIIAADGFEATVFNAGNLGCINPGFLAQLLLCHPQVRPQIANTVAWMPVKLLCRHISPSLPVFLSVYHTVLHLGIAIIADLQFQRSTRWQKCNSRRKTGIAFFHDKLISQPVEYNKKRGISIYSIKTLVLCQEKVQIKHELFK